MEASTIPTALTAQPTLPADLPSEHLEALICRTCREPGRGGVRVAPGGGGVRSAAGLGSVDSAQLRSLVGWQVSLDLRAEREKVRVAGALTALPLVSAEMAAARLSFSKGRTADDGRCRWEGDRLDLSLATELLLWHERSPWEVPLRETS